MAALTILSESQSQLSLQQHLDIAPDILGCSAEELEGELQPLIMAQAVPNPPGNEKKRVKVYELRNMTGSIEAPDFAQLLSSL